MILNYSIQNIKNEDLLLGVAFKTLNKTDVFNFLSDLPELEEEITTDTEEACLFYIEDEEGIVFTRFIANYKKANTVKDKLVDFILERRSFLSKLTKVFKEVVKELPSAASYAAHR